MIIRKSAYYDDFVCLAAACPDSCCKEWDVLVDPASAARYRALPGPLGDRLRQVLKDSEDGTYMEIEDRRCPMWRADGLCRIQAELGEDALCATCRDFPRLRHDYGDFVELGLELSCPEAAKFILSDREFAVTEQEVPGGKGEYDPEVMELLRRSRETALSILRDRRYTIPEALTLLLLLGCEVQGWIDGADEVPFDPDAALEAAKNIAGDADPRGFLDFFTELEILTPEWREMLNAPEPPAAWPEELRAMAGYLVRRYWLQAVSDYDLYSRAKLVAISCLAVRLIGGDPARTAQLYSKEIENSAENVDAILDAAYSHPALTDRAMLALLQ